MKTDHDIIKGIPRDETETDMNHDFYTKNEVLHCMQAARVDERERISAIITKHLDLAQYSYDEATIEMLAIILKQIK